MVHLRVQLASFVVSGIGHEIIFCHLCDVYGTFCVFFTANALAIFAETVLTQLLGEKRRSSAVEFAFRAFTITFLVGMSELSFFGPLCRRCNFQAKVSESMGERIRLILHTAIEDPRSLTHLAISALKARS